MLFSISAAPALPPVSGVTPLKHDRFALELQGHPDQERVSYVLNGIRLGFKLGFNHTPHLQSAKRNKKSADDHPTVIDEYLANEVSLGRVAGPFTHTPIPQLHISSFGVIPKNSQPGKWRLIVDLSSPAASSVNDGIEVDSFSLQYIRVDDIIKMVSKFGFGALIAKFDVLAVYRNVVIHPSDRALLDMGWHGKFYVDLALPFGLRSAPFIFDSIAAMVEWILINKYQVAELVHYLGGFITAGPQNSNMCARNLRIALRVCTELGIPLHPDKCEGPSMVLVVLGIELDSINQLAHLPIDKLSKLRVLLNSWASRQWCRRKEHESLIGHLHHAAKVVWPGRTFLRRMINLLCCFRNDGHPIRLNAEFHLDLKWWLQFLETWNRVSFWLYPGMSAAPTMEVTSDAAGALGHGAYFNLEWFNGLWFACQKPFLIAYKELFPVVIAAHVWGHLWFRQHILFRSDNEAVVTILNSRTSKVPCIMRLVCSLLMAAARFNFSFAAVHVPGVENPIADALSRFRWQDFRQLAPWAQPSPTPIPSHLLEDLTSPH